MDEFDLIRRHFSRHAAAGGVVIGVGDDGAVLAPTPGTEQVQVLDTLVEGVHFPAATPAGDIGYRALAVNLSDIAAMGARPRWMTLALTLWDKDEDWVREFADGLYTAADEHDVALVGGDTTQGDAVVVSLNVTGEVPAGNAVLRRGAQPGDRIFVTGTLGDAAAGLRLLREGVEDDPLVQRFRRPAARIAAGLMLPGRAHASIDLSDGFVADLRKLLDASNCGAEIAIENLPLSAALVERFDADSAVGFALTGGDDYELCFTGPAGAFEGIDGITEVGVVTPGAELVCRRNGRILEVDDSGYRHFR